MSDIIKALEWRYATKKFDPTKKVSDEDIKELKRALQLTASSFGLQAYKIAIISNDKIQEELLPASWNQSQIKDASHIIHFIATNEVSDSYLDRFINLHRSIRKTAEDRLERFKGYLTGFLSKKSPTDIQEWSARQTYIAMGNILTVLGLKKIDGCPIEGINPPEWDRILQLPENQKSIACVAIGYRAEGDESQNDAKVRLPEDELFIEY